MVTPREWIDRARAVLGGIDVNPASSELAQKTVNAQEYFDKERNGLRQVWRGRVWLNPPYSLTADQQVHQEAFAGVG